MKPSYYSPKEVLVNTINIGVNKAILSPLRQFILGILAGAFIAFASEGSNMAAFNLFSKPELYGLGKFVAGSIFPVGIILVVVAGAELFTGNTLMIAPWLDQKISLEKMLTNWFFVYLGNFVGALFIAYMMSESGLFHSGANMLGATTIKIASYKVELTFKKAFFLGIMCNWLVCLAVWMSYAAQDLTGKMLAAYFPIWLFITSGFEHSVANMYYIPAGILAKSNAVFVEASGLTADTLSRLNWSNFFIHNLIPVTLGNIVGGGILVATIYWFVYRENPS